MLTYAQCYLTWDEWDDFHYRTLYGLVYIDDRGREHKIGGVRIAKFGQEKGPDHVIGRGTTFTQLDSAYFSLGSSEDYYDELNLLGAALRDEILAALNDIAKFPEIYDNAIKEEVTAVSLLRNFSSSTVTGQLRRMADGGHRLTDYRFGYFPPGPGEPGRPLLSFEVFPESFPPANIHVLIGRNGVGKTHLLNNMINSLLSPFSNAFGKLINTDEDDTADKFANLVAVSFSAFDESIPVEGRKEGQGGLPYYYIGLRKPTDQQPKSSSELCIEFLSGLNACKIEPLKKRWIDAITMLESDTNFKDSEVKSLIDLSVENFSYQELGENIFRKLSSGHKIILLTITRLIEKVQEKTLVMIDEPEAHLHPPLLSAFIRATAELLLKTNGAAIIATHSPVILQEVPRECAWKLRRSGGEIIAERPGLETFGENVGVLTSDVFGLEVTNSGFYTLLAEQVVLGKSYDEIIFHFRNQLGMEARAVLMALVNNRNNSGSNA